MKKFIITAARILAGLIVLLLVFLLVSWVRHTVQSDQESKMYTPPGQLVEVNGHSMHIYSEGEGDVRLVFLSGAGTCSPMLDFRTLTRLLSDDYAVTIIEKAGYGFSEDSDVPRDIDTMLEESRAALTAAGITGPYVLCPHSMSGLEAVYWAQKYPEEVQAIVGLDMAVPEAYEDLAIDKTTVEILSFAARAGLTRWIPGVADGEAVLRGTLTADEKDMYRAMFYRSTMSHAMLHEIDAVKENAAEVAAGGIPDVPMLLFASNGDGTGWSKEEWQGFLSAFAAKAPDATETFLDCSHYVQDDEAPAIAAGIRDILANLQ